MSKIELAPDQICFSGDMVCLTEMLYRQRSVDTDRVDKDIYNEAPDLVRIGGCYLFSWAIYDVLDYRYSVRYAWSKHPMGPYYMPLDFDHDNILLRGMHEIAGCAHSCITEYQGDYYILYGRRNRDFTYEFARNLCCDKIQFLDRDHLLAVPSAVEV